MAWHELRGAETSFRRRVSWPPHWPATTAIRKRSTPPEWFTAPRIDGRWRRTCSGPTFVSAAIRPPPMPNSVRSPDPAELHPGDRIALSIAQSYNRGDAMAAADLAVALRLAGRTGEAEKTITQALAHMPLLPYARAEQWIIETAQEKAGHEMARLPQEIGQHLIPPLPRLTCRSPRGTARLGDVDDSDAVLQLALKRLPAPAITPAGLLLSGFERAREGERRAG